MSKKFLTIFCTIFIICALTVPVFAEEPLDTEAPIETVLPTSDYEVFVSKIEAYSKTGFGNTVSYTSDSVHAKGIILEPYTNSVKFETGFVIRTDLGIGIQIYDDPATDIIEGIRVNGNTVTGYTVPIDLDNPQNYIVEVRLDYAEGLLGTFAKISDGNFSWETILEEPIIYTQAIYYLIAALSVIIGGIGAAVSKKKKVKTANEIAEAVDLRVKEGCETFAIAYTDVLKENLLPVFQSMVDTNKTVVKAITVSTSKTKDAPVALLDLFKEISDVNVEKAIDEAREKVLKNIADTDSKRAAIHNVLAHIAEGTYQEVRNVEQISEPERTEEISETTETKSVF